MHRERKRKLRDPLNHYIGAFTSIFYSKLCGYEIKPSYNKLDSRFPKNWKQRVKLGRRLLFGMGYSTSRSSQGTKLGPSAGLL